MTYNPDNFEEQRWEMKNYQYRRIGCAFLCLSAIGMIMVIVALFHTFAKPYSAEEKKMEYKSEQDTEALKRVSGLKVIGRDVRGVPVMQRRSGAEGPKQ